MRGTRAALAIAATLAIGIITVSGGSRDDPRTPAALPGLPPPFLGTAAIGGDGAAGAVDAYGDLVDLRVPGPAGTALIEIPPERQVAGTVPPDSGRVARIEAGRKSIPFWRADSVEQRYLPGTNVLRTVARFGARRGTLVRSLGGPRAGRLDRRWISRARPLAAGAPAWARRMYERSLLVLRALTDEWTGAVAAGARAGWAYVWPRDAGAVAIALASSGYRPEARRVVRFLLGLDLGAAARFDGSGEPVKGRAAQGDAAGWVDAAAAAAGVSSRTDSADWRDSADYQEKSAGDYLGNAIAGGGIESGDIGRLQSGRFQSRRGGGGGIRVEFEAPKGLVRRAGEVDSGLDSAAAWAVRPFPQPALFPAARRTLLRLAASSSRYGIVPSEDWPDEDPWTAPTAWSAWSLAVLTRDARRGDATAKANRDRRAALRLMDALRRAATPLGMLPERVDAQTGLPRSTTPLAWSHAFAILAIRELWPERAAT